MNKSEQFAAASLVVSIIVLYFTYKDYERKT